MAPNTATIMPNYTTTDISAAERSERNGPQDLVVATNPKSSFAEAIKSAKTNIMFSSIGKDFKTIAVTSPESGDGKSFIVANLAIAFSQDGKRVLVIDGDLRRGRQHQIFSLASSHNHGYSNLILGYGNTLPETAKAFISSHLRQTAFPGITILPAGPTPPNPLELLSSTSNHEILKSLRQEYDIILIDCPPVLGLSDALVLSKLADINIVTITSNKTKIDELADVKKAFEKVNSKISGVIINKAKVKGSSYSSYYADKYYSDNK
ncbi:CpsD/CapB family tyrosine-protein kinase [Candidatus Saccharibacteria bacterium]|nr:CpsD/CapB family tyrosine-protein kinase [Candidatus Saccharibacteria bacterium]